MVDTGYPFPIATWGVVSLPRVWGGTRGPYLCLITEIFLFSTCVVSVDSLEPECINSDNFDLAILGNDLSIMEGRHFCENSPTF